MPLDDGPFPCGRQYIYIVRSEDESFPLKHIYLSYNVAMQAAYELAEKENKEYHIDLYEETYNHQQMKYGDSLKMNKDLDSFA